MLVYRCLLMLSYMIICSSLTGCGIVGAVVNTTADVTIAVVSTTATLAVGAITALSPI